MNAENITFFVSDSLPACYTGGQVLLPCQEASHYLVTALRV